MAAPPELRAAAAGIARARRFLLLGRPRPWLDRAAAAGVPEADLHEHGAPAVHAAVQLAHAEPIDEGLAALQRPTVERPGESRTRPVEALAAVAHEEDPDEREGWARAIAAALPESLEAAAAALAACADEAAERGAPALVSPADLVAAREVLAATEEPARDVLGWATLRLGRSRRRRLHWTDVARVLRQQPLDSSLPSLRDPWPVLRAWREASGLSVDLRFESCTTSGFLGSWGLRLHGRLVAGAAGWPGALLWRFALQALGRADAAKEAGDDALLPADEGAAELLGALYPTLLAERAFLDRAVRWRPAASPDDARKLALSEILLARLQAAALQTLHGFEAHRSLGPLRDGAADAFRRALFVPVPPEVGLLFCRPYAPPLASPRAALAAAPLATSLRERFDFDWWRNPAAVPELRRLAAGAATAKLDELVPGGPDGGAYGRWVEERLGG